MSVADTRGPRAIAIDARFRDYTRRSDAHAEYCEGLTEKLRALTLNVEAAGTMGAALYEREHRALQARSNQAMRKSARLLAEYKRLSAKYRRILD